MQVRGQAIGRGAGQCQRNNAQERNLVGYLDNATEGEEFSPHSRQDQAAIGRSENGQPIRVTVHSRCVENFENVMMLVRDGLPWIG